jgi:hypothetical protein
MLFCRHYFSPLNMHIYEKREGSGACLVACCHFSYYLLACCHF